MSIDLTKPQYDQSTYSGRASHFFRVANPLNIFATESQLDEAKRVVTAYKQTKVMPPGYNEEKLWNAKYLYDSAFHPDTGEKMILIGRMSAQAPMNTLITGCMISFYKTNTAIIFWQWINQTFNAVVNYTNRSGDAPLSNQHLLASYCAACGGALGTALYLNRVAVRSPNPLFARLVPFAAVAAANFINIPMMRSYELMNGTPVFTVPEGNRVGESKTAARSGILFVCLSRLFMALPGMTITPVITNYVVLRGMLKPVMVLPFQLTLVGFCLTIATPLGCALFDQRATLSVDSLENELRDIIAKKYPQTKTVYYNKGLNKTITPAITNYATLRGVFRHKPMMVVPFQLALVGACVTLATPLGCALFDQRATLSVNKLEPELKEVIAKKYPKTETVYYNKGL